MKSVIVFIILITSFSSNYARNSNLVCTTILNDSIPSILLGNFTDDYKIEYTISDSLWIQLPDTKYHVVKWNVKDKYVITRNDNHNSSGGGLYTRIDYMLFEGMKPYTWGYCFTIYNAKTDNEAKLAASADRKNPKKGCGGFPFSRMKRKE